MEYLSVKEVAELKGCSERYIQNCISKGKLEAIEKLNAKGKIKFYVPISALPDDIRAKYYKQIRRDENAPPELKEDTAETSLKRHKNAVKRSFEEYSEAERNEITRWVKILEEWQALRSRYNKKTEFDPLYCSKIKIEQPDINISPDILYKKLAAYRGQNLDGLLDGRGGWNRNNFNINEKVWKAFLWFYLDERQPRISECYRNVCDWTAEFYPELLDCMPTERSFRRHVKSDIDLYVKTYKREGEKALLDRCAPYVERLYDNIHANSAWIADNHTLDVISFDGKTNHRLYITAFQDAKSGVIVGFNITENPSSQSTIIALRMAIMRFGIPDLIYLDNGSEFANHDIGGRGYRAKHKSTDDPIPSNIFQRLGITAQFAQVCNADAKPIERTFLTVKNQFSRSLETFCGGNITERPESLKRIIKDGKRIPTDSAVRELLGMWIDNDYNIQPYGGSEKCFKGMSRIEVWNADIKETGVKLAGEAELNLMLMRTTRVQKVKRNGVFINISGEKLWYYDRNETCRLLKKEVFVRYDPADLTQARIYDSDDRYMSTWRCADALMCDFIDENKNRVRDAEEMKRSVVKYMKKTADGLLDGLSKEERITAIDLKVRRAGERSGEFRIELPSKIIPIRINEEQAVPAAVGGDIMPVTIDYERINRNLMQRKENENG